MRAQWLTLVPRRPQKAKRLPCPGGHAASAPVANFSGERFQWPTRPSPDERRSTRMVACRGQRGLETRLRRRQPASRRALSEVQRVGVRECRRPVLRERRPPRGSAERARGGAHGRHDRHTDRSSLASAEAEIRGGRRAARRHPTRRRRLLRVSPLRSEHWRVRLRRGGPRHARRLHDEAAPLQRRLLRSPQAVALALRLHASAASSSDSESARCTSTGRFVLRLLCRDDDYGNQTRPTCTRAVMALTDEPTRLSTW